MNLLSYFVIVYSTIASLFIATLSYTSATPSWLTSPYLRAGNQKVIQTLTGNSTTPTYVFTFSSPLTDIPKLAYGLKAYKGNDYLGVEQFSIERLDLNRTNFKVQVQIYGVTNVRILDVAYLAVQPSFPHHINTFDNIPVNSTGDITNISVKQPFQQTFTQITNYTNQAAGLTHRRFMDPIQSNKILLFMTTMWIWATFRNGTGATLTFYPVRLKITSTILNYEQYSIEVKTYHRFQLKKLHFSQVIFNYNDVRSSNEYELNFQIWENDKFGQFHPIPYEFIDNFILGLLDFTTIDGRCAIFYNWEFKMENSDFGVRVGLIPLDIGDCSFQTMRSSVFYMRTWDCPDTHPYYNTTSLLCQDSCAIRYHQNGEDLICLPCQQDRCLSCDSDLYLCSNCDSNSFLFPNGTCRDSYCNLYSVNNALYSLNKRSLQKTQGKNQIILVLQVSPSLANSVQKIDIQHIKNNPNSYLKAATVNYTQSKDYISFPTLNTTLFIDNSTIITSFAYKDDLQGIVLPFEYTLTIPLRIQDGEMCFKFLNLAIDIQMQTSNNIPILFEDPKEAQQQAIIKSLSYTMAGLSLGFLLVGAFCSSKIVGLEHSGLLQLAFFSLSDYQKINPLMNSLADMKFLNGYNNIHFLSTQEMASDSQLPQRIMGINYSSYFLENCNVFIIIWIALLFTGTIILILSKFFKKVSVKLAWFFIMDIGLTLLLFNLFNISFSTAIHLKYAIPIENYEGYYIGSTLLMCVCVSIPFIFALGILFTSYNKTKHVCGQFRDKFKNNFQSRNYISVMIVYRFSIAFYMATKTQQQLSTMIILAFSLLFLLYNLVNLPFCKAYHNYRAIACHLTHFYILFITMFYRSMKSNNPLIQTLGIKSPIYIQIGLLIFCTTVSCICLVYDAYKYIQQWRQRQKENKKIRNLNNSQSDDRSQIVIFQRMDFQIEEAPAINVRQSSHNMLRQSSPNIMRKSSNQSQIDRFLNDQQETKQKDQQGNKQRYQQNKKQKAYRKETQNIKQLQID